MAKRERLSKGELAYRRHQAQERSAKRPACGICHEYLAEGETDVCGWHEAPVTGADCDARRGAPRR